MSSRILPIALVIAASVVAQAYGEKPAFQFFKEVKPPEFEQQELLAVELDADVFAATTLDFADLRVLDADGKMVPYVLKLAQTTRIRTTRKTWAARKPAAHPLEGGGLEITIELRKDDPQPDGLRVITPLRNFEQRIRVFSSADGQQWEPQGKETEIFDYSRYMDVRSDAVAFPATPHRHIRIVVDKLTLQQESDMLQLTRRLRGGQVVGSEQKVTVDRRPFRIERIEFWKERQRVRETGDRKTSYAVAGFRVEEDAEEHQTRIFVDTRKEPITSFVLKTTTGNFSRHATVEIEETRGKQSSWRKLGAGVLSRIDFKNLKREELEITFPETRSKQYRIVVNNRDSPPLEISGVEARGNVREVLFLATPGGVYRLAYQSAEAKLPDYDTAAIQALLREGFDATKAQLGEQQKGAAAAPSKTTLWDLLRNPRLLVGLIVLLVIILSWALYSASRRLDKLPEEEGKQKA